jgi:hypothetical protein
MGFKREAVNLNASNLVVRVACVTVHCANSFYRKMAMKICRDFTKGVLCLGIQALSDFFVLFPWPLRILFR